MTAPILMGEPLVALVPLALLDVAAAGAVADPPPPPELLDDPPELDDPHPATPTIRRASTTPALSLDIDAPPPPDNTVDTSVAWAA